MRININEALYIYLNSIINQLRLHKKKSEIIKNVSKLLTPNQVMIGVPESLREVNFNINTERKQKFGITVTEPISTTSYILVADLENTKESITLSIIVNTIFDSRSLSTNVTITNIDINGMIHF